METLNAALKEDEWDPVELRVSRTDSNRARECFPKLAVRSLFARGNQAFRHSFDILR